jgi:hypothetical protein
MQAHTPSHPALSERVERDANDTMTRGTGALVVNTVGTIMDGIPIGVAVQYRTTEE